MKRTLRIIGTSHEENGLTTVENLYKEITKIAPDVILEEIPVDMFSGIYERHLYPDSFEVQAVRKYTADRQCVNHFPIDTEKLPQLSASLSCGAIDTAVDEYIKRQTNRCFAKIITEKPEKLDTLGCKKMNSAFHRFLENLKQQAVKRYLLKHNKELHCRYEISYHFHFEIREYFMLEKIIYYLERYNNPLLIIGYSHIPTLTRKIKKVYKQIRVKIG
ncbi:hypothetical protein [Treponema pedis]|uniref:hypothetical protein n=1 Tax=Treponema pedis TaxID=409322 RepID=UPI0004271EE3|nr:hypothetical protein [Treponema pedis]